MKRKKLRLMKTGQNVETEMTREAVLATVRGAIIRFRMNFNKSLEVMENLDITSLKGSAKNGSRMSTSKEGPLGSRSPASTCKALQRARHATHMRMV